MGVGGQRHAPAALTLGKRAGTHFVGVWMGSTAGADGCGKFLPLPRFDPRTVQPVPPIKIADMDQNKLKGIWKKPVVANIRHYKGILWNGLNKP